MRQLMMFVAGFAMVAMAGVAVAQTSLVPGTASLESETTTDFLFVPGAAATESEAPLPKTESPPRSDPKTGPQPKVESRAGSQTSTKTTDPASVELSITHPEDGARIEAGEVLVKGKTSPGAYVWSGAQAAEVHADGTWSMTVPLVRGKNVIHVGATLDGVSSTAARTVFWGDALVWSITQKVKASETAVEKFSGTGSPGMVITATSAHGSAATTIPASGTWLLKVAFGSVPGTTFPVTVTTSTGWTQTYSFAHLGKKSESVTEANQAWTIKHKYAVNHAPYTKFYGTGPVGTKVTATSPFGSAETVIGKKGDWYLEVHFDVEPGSTFDVHVTNSAGFSSTYLFTYKASDFHVEQVHGSSWGEPAYEVFRGRTAPSTWVKAWSEYGWTKAQSDGEGWFQVEVVFEGAPFDTSFPVDVVDGLGNTRTFNFIAKG